MIFAHYKKKKAQSFQQSKRRLTAEAVAGMFNTIILSTNYDDSDDEENSGSLSDESDGEGMISLFSFSILGWFRVEMCI